ncbi:ABC transporter substrate-binding protein [Candidatus Gottesmanbacteria bacterium]|nr:ABC transporter substrate-binding protein [Candidatus Gottesmanbacteria bacterium]
MSKKIIFLILIFIAILTAVFFYKNVSNRKTTTVAKVTILLDWFHNTNHTGIYVAKEKGYFSDKNLDVEILHPAEGDNIQITASGKADFAVSSQEAVTLAKAKDIPVVSVAAIIQHNTSAFASLPKSNIKSVKDFEGKRYGGWGSPIEEAVIKAVMEEAGADFSKVKNITIGETDFFKTIGKDSDFQWIFYGWDGIEAERRGIKLNTIMLKDLNPILDYYTPVIITSANHIKTKKELVERIVKAVSQGYEYSISHPQESAEILLKYAPELNRKLVIQSQQYLSHEYKKDAPKWGIQREEVWSRYSKWLSDHKLIEKEVNAKEMFTDEFLNE